VTLFHWNFPLPLTLKALLLAIPCPIYALRLVQISFLNKIKTPSLLVHGQAIISEIYHDGFIGQR